MAATPRVLVPVEILEGETVAEDVMELLATLPVVVLGYHELPEQTPPGQARLQFEEGAQVKLDELAAGFREAGGAAESRLVFTNDEEQTIERVADEADVAAILIPNPAMDVDRLLVPVGSEANIERIAAFVAALIGDRDIDITLLTVVEDEAPTDEARSRLGSATTALKRAGVPGSAIETDLVVAGSRVDAIASTAVDHGAVVMGETEPTLRSFLFCELPEQIAARSLGPVVVVRRAVNSDQA